MKIEMYGEHEVRIKFNNSHSCNHWLKEIRDLMERKQIEEINKLGVLEDKYLQEEIKIKDGLKQLTREAGRQ